MAEQVASDAQLPSRRAQGGAGYASLVSREAHTGAKLEVCVWVGMYCTKSKLPRPTDPLSRVVCYSIARYVRQQHLITGLQ